jgi:hypothetical protein
VSPQLAGGAISTPGTPTSILGAAMRARPPFALWLAAALAAGCARHPPTDPVRPTPSPGPRQFTFAWPFRDGDAMQPRGGTTRGAPLTLDPGPTPEWLALQQPGLSAFERDRRAILAMAGPYRASFDFLEIEGFHPGFTPDRPYQSWSTEYVYVVEDRGPFISLQHVIVAFVQRDDGSIEGPMVQKHWRQDWTYEDRELLTYRGHDTWARERLPASAVRGTWSQAVFNVDDSPRYASYGRWEHQGGMSTWRSAETWRPLPRREFTVRHDYDVLIGTNQHTITPTGWVQQEENLKVALDASGNARGDGAVLAKELGVNRYERLAGFDFSAGDRYWERSGPFWAEVRGAWDDTARRYPRFTIRTGGESDPLFVPFFEYAQKLADGAPFDQADAARFARETIARRVQPSSSDRG